MINNNPSIVTSIHAPLWGNWPPSC